MKVSLDDEVVELLQRRQASKLGKNIDEIAYEVLKEQIAKFNADPAKYEFA